MTMLAILAGVLAAPLAHADVVGPDATGCPYGSVGTSNHGGPYCVPQPECGGTADDACNNGTECNEVELCVLVEERPCGGMTTPGEECTYTHREAFEPGANESCGTDEGAFSRASRCVEPKGCTTAPMGALGASGALLLGLALLARRRRG